MRDFFAPRGLSTLFFSFPRRQSDAIFFLRLFLIVLSRVRLHADGHDGGDGRDADAGSRRRRRRRIVPGTSR